MAPEGGLFHDGRARDLLEQVQSPLFHKQEMNLPDRATLAQRMRKADYSPALREWVGEENWNNDEKLNQFAFRALVEFLREPLFRPFDARIDDFLAGDENALTVVEKRGLEVFRNAGKCADCHLLEADQWSKPLLSDFGYDNLRVPSREKPDPGLGGISKKEAQPSHRKIILVAGGLIPHRIGPNEKETTSQGRCHRIEWNLQAHS